MLNPDKYLVNRLSVAGAAGVVGNQITKFYLYKLNFSSFTQTQKLQYGVIKRQPDEVIFHD